MTARSHDASDGHASMPIYLPGPVHAYVTAEAQRRRISKAEVVRDFIYASLPEDIRSLDAVQKWTPRAARQRKGGSVEPPPDMTLDWQKVKTEQAAQRHERDALFKEIRRLKTVKKMGSTAIAAQLRVPYKVVSEALNSTAKGRPPRSATEVGK